MAGPIGFGVFKALDKRRRSRAPWRPGQGWWYFVIATIGMSWLTAGLLGAGQLTADDSAAGRLWSASIYYAATMGWQPLVAAWLARAWRDRPAPLGDLGWPRTREVALAVGVAIGLGAAAMGIAYLAGEPAGAVALAPRGEVAVVAGVLVVLCLQALTEELGWRGAPLGYAIERWGVRAGLCVHGLVWGAWYAPLFLLSSPTPIDSLAPAGGFVVTCLLLGIVLGWLRLRSRSVAPPAIANALLTITAGLPLLFHAGSSGIRDAVFRWPGLPVIGAAAVLVLLARRRDLEPKPAAS